MRESSSNPFRQRVVQAAEAVLKHSGSVGPLELFQAMGLLQPVHFEGWQKGDEHYRDLESWIQVGPEKFDRTLRCFAAWVKERGLRPIEASYTRRGPGGGLEQLQVTKDGDPEREKFYRTHYAPELSAKQAAKLEKKLHKAPDLVVFITVSDDSKCAECGADLSRGSFLFLEKGQALCLACADLDHLVFLPAGDTALSRRSRKHSPLSAVVVRFNRNRKRYERQGLLVTPDALDRAEQECMADAPERAEARARAAVAREAGDREFVEEMTRAILEQFPSCPPKEARSIAAHTALRGSGRVGRSAAGRALDPRAIELAVVAHIRHAHTDYDLMLMQGTDRLDARALVREKIDAVIARWTGV
ncbi:MAG: DUF2293 domain-containing protein [Verrucomicrobiota bacterium]